MLCAASLTADKQDQEAEECTDSALPLALQHSLSLCVSFSSGEGGQGAVAAFTVLCLHWAVRVLWCGNLEISSTAALLLPGEVCKQALRRLSPRNFCDPSLRARSHWSEDDQQSEQ